MRQSGKVNFLLQKQIVSLRLNKPVFMDYQWRANIDISAASAKCGHISIC
jgi:hypothetical protein